MTRPTITEGVIGELTDAAPGRLIRKLDKNPERAESWTWTVDGETTRIETDGDAVVTLTGDAITTADQVSCDCLLAPKCLHILSVVVRLPIGDADVSDVSSDEASSSPELEDSEQRVEITAEQRVAATKLKDAVVGLLADGVQQSGIVAQGRVLTALHRARLEGLYRAATGSTRIVKRVRAIKEQKVHKLSPLRDDLVDVIDACDFVIRNETATRNDVGVARRHYHPAGALRLSGITTAAVRTDSGYGGCVTYLIDADGRFSTVSTVQPLDMRGPQRAWHQSVEIGDVTAPHSELVTKQLFLQNATRSSDGRLGAGKDVRAVVGKDVDYDDGQIAKWFATPFKTQIDRVYENAKLPELHRQPGGDFIAFRGTVSGTSERGVVIDVADEQGPLLAVFGNDTFGNVTRLGTMCGQEFRFVARVLTDALRTVQLLTLVTSVDGKTIAIQLGLEHLTLEVPKASASLSFPSFPRAWTGFETATERAMLGGWRAFPSQSKRDVDREASRLRSVGMYHAATRLQTLYVSSQRQDGAVNPAQFVDAWCRCSKYRDFFLREVSYAQW